MDAALIRYVWQRARGRCEYCQLPQEFDDRPFEIDHIRSRKHHGPTVADNLALSCFRRNSFKCSDIILIDKLTHKLTSPFNPRRHLRPRKPPVHLVNLLTGNGSPWMNGQAF